MEWKILIGCVIVLYGCGMRKTEVREKERIADRASEKIGVVESGETLIEKDTVVMVRAPAEESRSVGEDSSWLQTSLAWSVAVWKEGRLRHEIGNFPSIPVTNRVVYRDRWLYRQDTLMVRDTFREIVTERLEKIRPVSVWERCWGWIGKIMIIVMAGYLAWYKLKSR